jgi:hypothetical protein
MLIFCPGLCNPQKPLSLPVPSLMPPSSPCSRLSSGWPATGVTPASCAVHAQPSVYAPASKHRAAQPMLPPPPGQPRRDDWGRAWGLVRATPRPTWRRPPSSY